MENSNWKFYTQYEFVVQSSGNEPESKVIEFKERTVHMSYLAEETHFYDWCQGVMDAFESAGYSVLSVWRKTENDDFVILKSSECKYQDSMFS